MAEKKLGQRLFDLPSYDSIYFVSLQFNFHVLLQISIKCTNINDFTLGLLFFPSTSVSNFICHGIKQEWWWTLSCVTPLLVLNKPYLLNFVVIQFVKSLYVSFTFLKHILTLSIFLCLTKISVCTAICFS
jgi:hypothetical protein